MTAAASSFDIILGIGLLTTAALALFLPRRSSSVVLFLVFGLLLAIVWARLGAPDVALAEAVLGAGVTGALLLAAVTRQPTTPDADRAQPTASGPRRQTIILAVSGTFLGLLLVGALGWTLLRVTPLPTDLTNTVAERMPDSGVEHPVTAVLLNFRSYDTLLEIAVLAIAALATLALATPQKPTRSVRTVPSVLDVIVRVLAPVLVLLIGWLLVAGTTRPGGAFQAGAVLAAALILGSLVRRRTTPLRAGWAVPVIMFGLAVFLIAAIVTAITGAGWLAFDAAWAEPLILTIEIALTISIGVALATLFIANRGEMR